MKLPQASNPVATLRHRLGNSSILANRVPLLRLGFRPFMLLAMLAAVSLMPVWLLALSGHGSGQLSTHWHGHEMIFGYTLAVVAGFLLTAVRNWTGVPTPVGLPLALLALLWLVGRLAMLGATPIAWPVDALLIPALALAIGHSLLRARNWRNAAFAPLLLLLFALDLWFHLDPTSRSTALDLALAVILIFIIVIGGRVVPNFTQNALPGVKVQRYPFLDWLALAATVAAFVLWTFGPQTLAAWLFLLAGMANAGRMVRWGGWAARRVPVLWILHAGYAFVPLGLWLRAVSDWAGLPPSAATHALTAGAIGTLTIGMMTRVCLGHTGRPVKANGPTVFAYCLVIAAALVRTFGPLFDAPGRWMAYYQVSGLAWTTAFVIFLGTYGPLLLRTRADGRLDS